MRLVRWASREDAARVLRDGFRDREHPYSTETTLKGVWLSEVPLSVNEGVECMDVLLEVILDLPETEVAKQWEVTEDEKTYREFIIPADVLNEHGSVREADLDDPTLPSQFGDSPVLWSVVPE